MYGIKIDKRKKTTFDNAIRKCVKENRLWCNLTEDDYVDKSDAKIFETIEDAENAITEEWEIACRI